MDESQLRAFVAITREGSFTAAAEKLHLTQPAISKRINALETQLGCQLFDRVGREALLTDIGNKLLPIAEKMLILFTNLRKNADILKNQVAGTLHLATSHHIGLHRLPPVLRGYTYQYPDVELALHFVDSEDGVRGVESGELELAIITLPTITPDSLLARTVWDDPLAIVVSRDHALADARQVSMEQLTGHEAILPGASTFTRSLFEDQLQSASKALRVGLSTNYLETNKMMASIGLGWTLLPLTMLDDSVCRVDTTGITLKRELGYVIHREMTLSNAARAMVDILDGI
jgi:DNA-binding transcriptional LysR family regulator